MPCRLAPMGILASSPKAQALFFQLLNRAASTFPGLEQVISLAAAK